MGIEIILVDDHRVIRDGLKALIEAEEDLRVCGEASNGREAINLTNKHQPDIVVMDIAMPDLNGIDATSMIRKAHPETQVVMLSMHATKEHIYRALQAGARGYLLKESAGSEVVTAVRTVNSGRRYLSHKIQETLLDDYILQRHNNQAKDPIESLSSREREVLQLIAEGKSTTEIASSLILAHSTVDTYRSRLMTKLGISDLPSLIKFAIRNGLTSLD